MALSLTLNDPTTKAQYVNAYGQIDDEIIGISHGITYVFLDWYVSQLAAQDGADYIRRDVISIPLSVVAAPNPTFVTGLQTALTNNQIVSPLDALKTALYLLVLQQPDYAGAASV